MELPLLWTSLLEWASNWVYLLQMQQKPIYANRRIIPRRKYLCFVQYAAFLINLGIILPPNSVYSVFISCGGSLSKIIRRFILRKHIWDGRSIPPIKSPPTNLKYGAVCNSIACTQTLLTKISPCPLFNNTNSFKMQRVKECYWIYITIRYINHICESRHLVYNIDIVNDI